MKILFWFFFCQKRLKGKAGNAIADEDQIISSKKIIIFAINKKMTELKNNIENAWQNRELLKEETTQNAIREVIELLDSGNLRVAEPIDNGWKVNEWVKKAVVMYFPIQKMETHEVGIFEYHDKMLL